MSDLHTPDADAKPASTRVACPEVMRDAAHPHSLEVHVFIPCSSQADGAQWLRKLADCIESGAGEFRGFNTGCEQYRNLTYWHFEEKK